MEEEQERASEATRRLRDEQAERSKDAEAWRAERARLIEEREAVIAEIRKMSEAKRNDTEGLSVQLEKAHTRNVFLEAR